MSGSLATSSFRLPNPTTLKTVLYGARERCQAVPWADVGTSCGSRGERSTSELEGERMSLNEKTGLKVQNAD